MKSVTYVEFALGLNPLELLLHGFLLLRCVVACLSSGLEQLELLVLQTLAALVVLLDLHQDLVLVVLVGAHDSLHRFLALVAFEPVALLLEHEVVHAALSGLLDFEILLVALAFDLVDAAALVLSHLRAHLCDVCLSLLVLDALLL